MALAYTFLQLQDEVIGHQLNDTKYRPSVKKWLNEGQVRIFMESELRSEMTEASFNTVAGTATLTLPTDYVAGKQLRRTADTFILDEMDLRSYDDAPVASGKPHSFVIIGSTITLYPTPDAG